MEEKLIRYVRVGFPDVDFTSWYSDEDAISEKGDWVKVDRSWMQDITGVVLEVRHCLESEPPYSGRIKPINSLEKTRKEIEETAKKQIVE